MLILSGNPMLIFNGTQQRGLPDAVGKVWPKMVVQTCVVHSFTAASFRYPTDGTGTRSRKR